jgi:large subunit ribosomal protein L15
LKSSPTEPITARELLLSGCIHQVHDGVKLLGDVRIHTFAPFSPQPTILQGAEYLKVPIHVEVARASKTAIRAVEKLGGSIVAKYYNALALRDAVHGRTDRKSAAPTRRPDIGICYPHIYWSRANNSRRSLILQNGTRTGRTVAIYPPSISNE